MTDVAAPFEVPDGLSLQERYTPQGRCFGCGPANDKGLRIRSFPQVGVDGEVDGDEVICRWTAASHHEAFENVVNGGILGSLLDCHSNWAAAWHVLRRDGLDALPVTVTADFHVKLKRPTPRDQPLYLTARAVRSEGKKIVVDAAVEAGGKVTATCRGTFVTVGGTHPAAQSGAR